MTIVQSGKGTSRIKVQHRGMMNSGLGGREGSGGLVHGNKLPASDACAGVRACRSRACNKKAGESEGSTAGGNQTVRPLLCHAKAFLFSTISPASH